MSDPTSPEGVLLVELAGLDDASLRARIAAARDPRALLDEALRLLERQKIGDPAAVERDAARLAAAGAAVLKPSEADAVRRRALLTRAPALTYANRFEEAIALLDAAGDGADATTRAEVALRLVQPLARMGRLEEAAERAHAAARGFHQAGLSVQGAKAEVNAGVVERMRGRLGEALAAFDRARPAFVGDPPTLAQVESNRAVALLELARFGEADAAFEAALRAFREARLARAVAIVEGNLADLDARRGRLASALQRFETAGRLFEQEEAPGDAARVRAEAAELLAQAGMRAEAARALDEALPVLQTCGLRAETARARLARAALWQLDGGPAEAVRLAAEARQAYVLLGNALMVAACDIRRAEAMASLGLHDDAARAFDAALDAVRGRPLDTQHAAASAALAALDAGRTDRAAALAAQLETLHTEHPVLTARACFARGMVARATGQPGSATERFREAVGALHAAQGMLQADRFRVAFMGGHGEILARFVAAMLEATPPESGCGDTFERTVLEATELARSHALLVTLGSRSIAAARGAHASAPDARRDESASGRAATSSEHERRTTALREELSALYTLLERDAGQNADAVRARIRGAQIEMDRLDRSRLAQREPLDPVHLHPADAITAVASARDTVVSYFGSGDELFACVLHAGSVKLCRRVASLALVVRLLDRLAFEIDRAARDALIRPDAMHRTTARAEAVLAELGKQLWAPVSSAVSTHAVTIVPFGRLHGAPWPALLLDGAPLADRHVVALCPSVAALAELQRRAVPGSASRLLVAVPDERAPHIAAEAQDLGPWFGDSALLGDEATVERIGLEAQHAALLHLATHGSFDPASPLDARLLLGDRWVSARELFALRLPGSVVVLTGCETGRAALAEGDETLGLSRALFAAGASLLVTSLWPVHDRASRHFAATLYSHLEPRLPASAEPLSAETLRRGVVQAAARAMLEVREQHRHPLFWAPFVAIGAGA